MISASTGRYSGLPSVALGGPFGRGHVPLPDGIDRQRVEAFLQNAVDLPEIPQFILATETVQSQVPLSRIAGVCGQYRPTRYPPAKEPPA
jgi:hypothetical protein